jgi:kynurenine formamidase
MRKTLFTAAAIFGAVAFSGAASAECTADNWKDCAGKPWVDGTVMDTPLGSKWWPNKLWGAGDQAGSTNWYSKPEVIKRAMSATKTGKVYKLGHEYNSEMPLFGARKFSLRIPGTPTGGAFGANRIMWNDEFLATEVGQVGTQFDGLGHIGVETGAPGDKNEMRWYNGFTAAEMGSPYGLLKLGTQELKPIVARGILLDIQAVRGRIMNKGEVITMADVKAALKKQGMEGFKFAPGDAIIFRTGWEAYWTDPAKFNDGCPGIGMEVARWVAEDVQAGVTGGDTWPVDAVPNPDPACVFCVHQYLQTRHGIVNQENMKLSELAKDGVYVFTYMYSPAPITGATGSMGAPIAIN